MPCLNAFALGRQWLKVTAAVLLSATATAAITVVALLVSNLGSVPLGNWHSLAEVAALFGVLGAMLGTIMALDRSAERIPLPRWATAQLDAPVARALICAALSALAVAMVRSWQPSLFSPWWSAAGAGVGAALGWWGWRWARYIDF